MKIKVIAMWVLIMILLISLAVVQGCGKKKTEESSKSTKTEVTQHQKTQDTTTQITEEKVPSQKIPPEEAKVYELQVVASPSYSNIITEKNKLEHYGYETKITTTKKRGELFYRLRLKGLYSVKEASDLGEELKNKFPSIDQYWLAKVK